MSTSQGKVKFERIELDKNVRKDLGDIDKVIASIKADGLLQPLVVWHINGAYTMPSGEKVTARYVLRAGYRRYEALRRIHEEDPKAFAEVPVTLYHGNESDARFAQIAENSVRKDLNPVELSDALREMTNKDIAVGDIGARVGLSPQWIGRLVKIHDGCTNAVLKALAKGEISVADAYELVGLPQEKQDKELEKYKATKEKEGSRAAKHALAKGAGKPKAPGKRIVVRMLGVIAAHEFKSDYWQGVTDALGYALGQSESLVDEIDKEAKRQGIDLDSDEKEAPEKGAAPKKGKKGRSDKDEETTA